MSKFTFQGTGQTTGGDGWKVVAAAAIILILSGGGAIAGAAAGVVAAVVDLLYWVAGVMYGTALLAAIGWFATRRLRAERQVRVNAVIDARRQAREDEIEQRHARRALASAHAQAAAWAPVITGIAAALQPPQPQPAPVIRAEVVER